MEISIADQVALDDALVAPADRLKIGKCNLRLSSDVTSKEATLQVVYDVLKLTHLYKAFQDTCRCSRDLMVQEFWLHSYVPNNSVRFKTNNKKHIPSIIDPFREFFKFALKSRKDPPKNKGILVQMRRNWCFTTREFPDAPDYDSDDDISWKSSDDDQDDEKAQDDEDEDKNDIQTGGCQQEEIREKEPKSTSATKRNENQQAMKELLQGIHDEQAEERGPTSSYWFSTTSNDYLLLKQACTRSVVIQRRVEDLQLGVESYQKKLNLIKPDTYRSNLRRKDAYTPYSDPRGFIYENKDKKNRLIRIDELHKFSAMATLHQRDKVKCRANDYQAIDKRLNKEGPSGLERRYPTDLKLFKDGGEGP
ncbi:hypothetical protein Tco_0658392 [Tanacetum coccineum]